MLLAGGIGSIVFGLYYYRHSNYDFNKLIVHAGTIATVDTTTVYGETSRTTIAIVQMDQDSLQYVASKLGTYLFDNLKFGDSVKLYTKPKGMIDNTVGEMGAFKWTNLSTEIYHLVRLEDNNVMIDFEDDKSAKRHVAWELPIVGVLMILYSLFIFSKRSNRFIFIRGGIDIS